MGYGREVVWVLVAGISVISGGVLGDGAAHALLWTAP